MMLPRHAAVAAVVDHTFLKTERQGVSLPEQTAAVRALIEEAAQGKAFGVCVRPGLVKFARALIDEKSFPLKVVTVAGFPIGDDHGTQEILDEIAAAREHGADEYDIVAKIGALRAGREDTYQRDLATISKSVGAAMLKIIFENAYLTREEKPRAYRLAREALDDAHARAPFPLRMFKTSTGFATPPPGVPIGATLDDVALMTRYAGPDIGVKAAGGVLNFDDAVAFWQAAGAPLSKDGAHIPPEKFRIGSSSLLKSL